MGGAAQETAQQFAVSLQQVSHDYVVSNGDVFNALTEVTLAVPNSQIVSIVGPSGCGKSTLLNIVGGLIAPARGTVSRQSRRIGLVPQRPGLLNWRSLTQNIALPLELAKSAAPSGERVREMLDLVQLTDHAHAYPVELSGGMQSRAAIARALVNEPDLLLLDEPFGALDEVTGQELVTGLSALLHRTRPTVLMITHSVSQAVFLSDRVIVMAAKPGRIVGTVECPFSHPRPAAFADSEDFARVLKEVRQRLWNAK